MLDKTPLNKDCPVTAYFPQVSPRKYRLISRSTKLVLIMHTKVRQRQLGALCLLIFNRCRKAKYCHYWTLMNCL